MGNLVGVAGAHADLIFQGLGERGLFADLGLGHEENFAHSESSSKHVFAICVGTTRPQLSQTANMTDVQWFARDWRKEKGRTLESVAEDLGTSVGYLSDMEKGKRRHNSDWAERLAAIYEILPRDLYRHPDNAVAGVTTDSVPVVGYVSAGAELALYDQGQGPFDYVSPPRDSKPSTVAASVKGVSLGPLLDEAIIFYDDVRSPVTSDLHGKMCVVGLEDGRVVVKQLLPGDSGRFHLLSNSAEPPLFNEVVAWAAKVTDIRPR